MHTKWLIVFNVMSIRRRLFHVLRLKNRVHFTYMSAYFVVVCKEGFFAHGSIEYEFFFSDRFIWPKAELK